MKALYFYPACLTIALESVSENKTIVHHHLGIRYRVQFLSLIPDWVVGHTLFHLKKENLNNNMLLKNIQIWKTYWIDIFYMLTGEHIQS